MNTTAIAMMLSILCICDAAGAAQENKPIHRVPHVVFVTGDHEYRSEVTMPLIARILEEKHGMKCTVLYSVDPATGRRDPQYEKNIEGLQALKTADLMVIFTRYRQLPDDQLRAILDYVHSGRPIVGLRTSTHAFRFPPDNYNSKWNDGFGYEVLGQKWISHHGHDSSTNVDVMLKDHPITRGLAPRFHCASWLYNVMPLHGDCVPLALGAAVKGDQPSDQIFGTPNPVAWTKTYNGARVFCTTLGHPKDFDNESMRRLLVNGIYWALGMEDRIPPQGANVSLAPQGPSTKPAP